LEKKIRTSHVLWAYSSRQRTVRRESQLIRIKLRIKSVLIKMNIQYAHGCIDKGPGNDKRFSVDMFADNIERLTRAANTRLFPFGVMNSATAFVIVSIHHLKNVLPRKLTNAYRPHDIPNGYHARRIDS